MNFLFRFFLTTSALSLFFALYVVKGVVTDDGDGDGKELIRLAIIAIPFIFTGISIFLSRYLGSDNLGKAQFIETANNDFLSNYLAFFFIALTIEQDSNIFNLDFIFIFGITLLFTFYSRVSYFNPILLLFNYNFYYIHLENNSKILLITKERVKSPLDIDADKPYRRINDYTFMEA